MRLKSISIEGYRSAAHGKPLVMDRLGYFNILIGPNNSGKSTVCRFLEVLTAVINDATEFPLIREPELVDSAWWWQNSTAKPIRAELTFAGPAPSHDLDTKAEGRFQHDDKSGATSWSHLTCSSTVNGVQMRDTQLTLSGA